MHEMMSRMELWQKQQKGSARQHQQQVQEQHLAIWPPACPTWRHGHFLPLKMDMLSLFQRRCCRLRFAVALGILVKWLGRVDHHATWEPMAEFKEAFPSFQLEDKLYRKGEMLYGD